MSELISIVVPVYNVEKYIHKCMQSILCQSYNKIEVILVNDGSTDKSGEICDEYQKMDSRVKVIHKENGGLSDARNAGIKNANGKYIMFVDSDDYVSEKIVEYLYNMLKQYDAEIAICDPVHCYPEKEVGFEAENKRVILDNEKAVIEMLYQKSFLVSAWAKLYNIRCFDEIEFPVGMLFEDGAIMYKLFDNASKVVYGNAKLYAYMHREGSITTAKYTERDYDIITICKEMQNYFIGRNENIQKAIRSYYISAALRIYLNAPKGKQEYVEHRNECNKIISDNYRVIIKDKNIRKKTKYALLMFKYCKGIMPIVYKKINRWK